MVNSTPLNGVSTFQHGVGQSMVVNLTSAQLSSKQWTRPLVTLMWRHARTGSATEDDTNVWLERTLLRYSTIIIWDNSSFHWACHVQDWFNNQFDVLPVPLLSWSLLWSYFGHGVGRPMTVNLTNVQLMSRQWNINVEPCQNWICQSRWHKCLARENIFCNINEVLWLDPHQRKVLMQKHNL